MSSPPLPKQSEVAATSPQRGQGETVSSSPPKSSPRAQSGAPASSPPGEQANADPAVAGGVEDTDSAVESESLLGSTASLRSSIFDYRKIHGRTFQASKTTEYWTPNDDVHVGALDIAHQWLTMMLDDELYAAPIGDKPGRILDIGTGSGVWAIDMADKFPEAEVIGVDITPTQPTWVPPNLKFQIDDVQQDWTFEEGSFDFIHVRYMHGALTDWPKFYSQMYKFLKPGGWFQHIEPVIEARADNPDATEANEVFDQWARLFYEAGDVMGREFRFHEKTVVGWAQDAGFRSITGRTFKLPLGPWPKDKRLKEMGSYVSYFLDLGLQGFALYPVGEVLGWTQDEVDVLVAKIRRVMKDQRNLSSIDMTIVYGQKPPN